MHKKTALLFFICALNLYAQTETDRQKNWILDISMYRADGTARELVYAYTNNDTLLSRLLWDIKNAWYLDAGLSRQFTPLLTVKVQGALLMYASTGGMTDYDWIPDDNFYGHGSYAWTHYSYSDAPILSSWQAGIDFSYKNYQKNSFTSFLTGGFKIDHTYWMGYGFDYIYSDDPEGIGVPSFRAYTGFIPDIKTISYKQNFFIPWLGLKFLFDFKHFSWETSAAFSLLTYSIDEDNHILRDTIFIDYAFPAAYLSASSAVSRKINDNYTFYLSAGFTFVPDERGNMIIREADLDPVLVKDAAGLGLFKTSFKAGIRYFF
jgi:outer membrane protease